jgi:AcrR family transcriptional regulator
MTERESLHERKKRAAMRRIQEVALDLFDAHGYESVTVEQIADAAEVSPSSVYRYFGTKEQVVLYERSDFEFLAVVDRELADQPPVDAVRRALAVVMTSFFGRDEALSRRKTRYALSEPALQPALGELTAAFVQQVAGALARATGRAADELEVQVVAEALLGALMAAVRHWHAGGYRTDIRDEMESALGVLERGLGLPDAPGVRSAAGPA